MKSYILFKFTFLFCIYFMFFVVFFLTDLSESADFDNYQNWFHAVTAYNDTYFLYKDPLYAFLSVAAAKIGLQVDSVIYALVFISLTSKVFYSASLGFSVSIIFLWLYFCRFFFVHDLIQFRIAAASGFALLFFYYFFRGKKNVSYMFFSLAILIHLSSILYIVIIPIVNHVKSKQLSASVFFSSCLMILLSLVFGDWTELFIQFFGNLPIIGDRIAPYLSGLYKFEALSLINSYLIFKLLLFLVFVILVCHHDKPIKTNLFDFQLVVFYLSMFGTTLFLLFRWNDSLALRFSDAFGIFDILFMSMFPMIFEKKLSYIVYFFVFIVGFAFLYSSLRV
ncbi:EpsG family protein [Shewanella oncorhynchi]|uniref:EpsG family protein n=1 Tax=Shewanella oncorhynchi TaxID=2726434 RepID=UPI003D792B4E